MEVYVNGQKQPTEEYRGLSAREVVQKIYQCWPDCMIEEVIYEEEEVPLIYFQEEAEKAEEGTEVEFILTDRDEVIERELERAEDYLPQLEGIIEDMIEYFGSGEKQEARQQYRSALEGLEWMQSTLVKIMRISEDKEIKLTFQDELREYQRAVKDVLIAYQQGRDGRLIQIFEEEILFYIKSMIKIAREGKR